MLSNFNANADTAFFGVDWSLLAFCISVTMVGGSSLYVRYRSAPLKSRNHQAVWRDGPLIDDRLLRRCVVGRSSRTNRPSTGWSTLDKERIVLLLAAGDRLLMFRRDAPGLSHSMNAPVIVISDEATFDFRPAGIESVASLSCIRNFGLTTDDNVSAAVDWLPRRRKVRVLQGVRSLRHVQGWLGSGRFLDADSSGGG